MIYKNNIPATKRLLRLSNELEGTILIHRSIIQKKVLALTLRVITRVANMPITHPNSELFWDILEEALTIANKYLNNELLVSDLTTLHTKVRELEEFNA